MKSPLEVVNKRMSLYNDHKLDEFLELYDSNIEIYTYPDKLLGSGLGHMSKLFKPMFEQGTVHVDVHTQIAIDSFVVNEETVSYGPDTETTYVSVYEVVDGLIKSVRFIRDQ